MIYDWDDTVALSTLTDWGVIYFVYTPPTVERAVLALAPRTAYFGFFDEDLPLPVVRPRTTYGTNGLLANSNNVAITLEPYPIIFHDGSNLTYHNGDHIAFHAYVFPEITRITGVPRTTYSGQVE